MYKNRFQSVIFLALVLAIVFQQSFGVSVDEDLSMTASEKRALDKFRQKVDHLLYKDYMKNDIYLIRWLRARNFDIESAEAMLTANINWRKEQKMDSILEDDWSDMRREYHATIDTYDREGRPIGVIDVFDWDLRAGVLRGKGPRILRYADHLFENITSQVFERQQRGMNVTQWKVLINADGFNMVQHGCPVCLPIIIQVIQSLEDHYPGWVDELIVIDANSAVHAVLQGIRPFLSRHTREALKVFGPNKSKWLPYLDQRIARDQRRPQYGGTRPAVWD